MSPPAFLRARAELSLAERIERNPDFARLRADFERESGGLGVRRQLLSTGIRLSEALVPELHGIIQGCTERLEVELQVEPYVYPSPMANAGLTRPEDGRVFLVLSSAMLDGFDDEELTFVVGHELAHHAFGHDRFPIAPIMDEGTAVQARLALELFSWSRFAEISADRGGLYCCGSLSAVARALFKLASGLSGARTTLAVDALLSQMEDIEASGVGGAADAAPEDWFSTHPFSPLRLKAAQLFAASEHMLEDGISADTLEAEVEALMGLMEPGYLELESDEARAMRRVLLAGGMMVAAADGEVEAREVEALEGLLGEGTVTPKLSVAALEADLPRRLAALKQEAAPARRAQVVRDLCVVSLADGRTGPRERQVIADIARALEVRPELVDQTFACGFELD